MRDVLRVKRERWDGYPEARKGRITHTWPEEGLFPHWKGRRTLRVGKRTIVEGIDFVIEG